MFVFKAWLDMHLVSEPNSLKGKRKIIKSIKDKIWNKFRVSIAEVGAKDLWQRAEIGIAFVTNDNIMAEKIFSRILNLIESNPELEVIEMYNEAEKLK